MKPFKVGLIISISVFVFVIIITFQFNITRRSLKPIAKSPDGFAYVGSNACLNCHANTYQMHINSTHFKTSQLANSINLPNKFNKFENRLDLANGIHYEMIYTDSGYYQLGFLDNSLSDKAKFDLIVGSGTKGQTYLHWEENNLLQLPVSYLSITDEWVNSPGYSNDIIQFNRPVPINCMECHSTFIQNKLPGIFTSNRYIKKPIILGIDCENCHGPSLRHAQFHIQNPSVRKPKFILQISSLSRQERLDVCARCHSGIRELKKPAFSFRPGNHLDDFSTSRNQTKTLKTLDVHGNQYGLLASSKCFIQSKNMDCSTCHNSHQSQRNQKAFFSQKCLGCHSENKISHDSFTIKTDFSKNCIDCHMPQLPSSAITFQTAASKQLKSLSVRTHLIAIYENNASQELLNYIEELP